MTPETKIPVYRREIARGISFTTFSAEGTTLLGWIDLGRHIPELARAAVLPDDAKLFGYTADAALAYARASLKGLKFEAVPPHPLREAIQQLYDTWAELQHTLFNSKAPEPEPKPETWRDRKPLF